jgi:hypothetical protein
LHKGEKYWLEIKDEKADRQRGEIKENGKRKVRRMRKHHLPRC